MAEGVLELVMLRNSFYRDNFHRCVVGLLISVTANVVALFLIFYLFTHRPSPEYFATNSEGRIVKLFPLSQPVVSNSYLSSWVNQAAVAAYTYNFVNYRSRA